MKKEEYCFEVLKYTHNVLSGEFVNLGLVVASPATGFLKGLFAKDLKRLQRVFPGANSKDVERKVQFLAKRFEDIANLNLPVETSEIKTYLRGILQKVLPQDDSALQFYKGGSGITSNPEKQLEYLFSRMVDQSRPHREHKHRTDNEVWKVFQEVLQKKDLMRYFSRQEIQSNYYQHAFKHCFQNGQLHILEAVSLDCEKATDVTERAASWTGKIAALSEGATVDFQVHFLLGAPASTDLDKAFQDAKRILELSKVSHAVEEKDAENFAEEVARLLEHEA